jgi:hypothetical protein
VSNVARDRVRVPLHSCEGGPWRALRVRGKAQLQHAPPGFRRLLAGDLLQDADLVRTGRRGALVFGAPRCHGLRFTLSSKSNALVGAYLGKRRGGSADVFGSMRARNGGVGTGFLSIQPLGNRVALYDVASRSVRRAVITVFRGKVVVSRAVNRTHQRLGFVRARETGVVRCKSPTYCSAVKVSG